MPQRYPAQTQDSTPVHQDGGEDAHHDNGAKVDVRRIEIDEIMVRLDNLGWASIRLQESTGSVSIQSDFGNWSYFWPPKHRTSSLASFLRGIDRGYAGGKFLGASLDVYDPEKTQKRIREHILESRRHGSSSMTKKRARKEWDLSEDLGSFDIWWAETSLYDSSGLHSTSMSTDWSIFWDNVWVPFVRPALKDLEGSGP